MPHLRATYRLQLHAGFPLSRVRELVPYLSRLGISHLHCSPMLRARRGTTHGYDVVDPTQLNPELGTEEELAELHRELRAHDMGIVLDIVPNHMAASDQNPAWEDVLAHGPASAYARWFDIDWRASERELRGRILLPVLGDVRVRVLEREEIGLALEDGVPRVRYYDHGYPLDPATMPAVLAAGAPACEAALGPDHPACAELRAAIGILRALPRRRVTRPSLLTRRREDAAAAMGRLRALADGEPRLAAALAEAVAAWGRGDDGRRRLRRLLDAQVYRLVYWRRAAREINYRRFFDVNDLIALHMEDPEVFAQTHALVLEWRRRGWVDGFRIDHPDGLLDPRGYFERLADAAFPGHPKPSPPVWVEKILAHDERLRPEWPVAGTTGYDFMNEVEALFLSPSGFEAIEQNYRRVIRQPLEFAAAARHGKRLILESGLSAGVRRLAERLQKLASAEAGSPAVPLHAIARGITEVIVGLPVYRTYVDERCPTPGDTDRRVLGEALAAARARGRAVPAALDLLEGALLATAPREDASLERLRLRFVQRFQQLSGPATAKGVEDTAFYVYTPLLSRNEVGGGPEASLTEAVAAFHAGNGFRARHFPRGMLAVTTHDTKRNADVRARLDVLSLIPDEWAARLDLWRRLNQPFKLPVRGRRLPDPNTVQHLFQALVGLWPLEPLGVGDLELLRERVSAYALKAVREAKQRTSWTEPNEEFEGALAADVAAILSPARAPRLLDEIERFARRIGRPGLWNALGRTVLHLASPGIPDIYQGDELWSFALVDPDNRRPVDFDARTRLLDDIERGLAAPPEARREFLAAMVGAPEDGRLKLHVIRAALAARRRLPDAFESGLYQPLEATGEAAADLVAFVRGEGDSSVVAVVARRHHPDTPGPAPERWKDTALRLPPGGPRRWTCALTGEIHEAADGRLPLDRVFHVLPAALLLPEPAA